MYDRHDYYSHFNMNAQGILAETLKTIDVYQTAQLAKLPPGEFLFIHEI